MKLSFLRLSGFQCFGPTVTEIKFDDLTFLIGPNGSGKTAVLQALCRLFAFDPVLRRVQRSDFHVPLTEPSEPKHIERTFWLEAEFAFPELADGGGEHPAIPPNFAHMRLDSPEGTPIVRFRLESHLSADDEIEDMARHGAFKSITGNGPTPGSPIFQEVSTMIEAYNAEKARLLAERDK